jgi:hypothetical protein
MKSFFETGLETDEEGYVILRLGFIATLYFHGGHTLEKRQAVIACFNEYAALCGEHLRWRVFEGGLFSPVAPTAERDIAPYLLSDAVTQSEDGWAFFWHGGVREEDASEFRLFGFGQPANIEDVPPEPSFLTATFPRAWASERPDVLLKLLLGWAERLQPLHGYAGIGIVDAADEGLAAVNENKVHALAMRHPGLEVDYPLDHCLYTAEGIKGGSWITVLSDAFIDRLGGSDAVQQKLGASFRMEKYQGGVLIIAGEQPEIGDCNRNIDTPNYRHLARVLKPIRILEHSGVGESFENWFSAEEFESWLRRFDD